MRFGLKCEIFSGTSALVTRSGRSLQSQRSVQGSWLPLTINKSANVSLIFKHINCTFEVIGPCSVHASRRLRFTEINKESPDKDRDLINIVFLGISCCN